MKWNAMTRLCNSTASQRYDDGVKAARESLPRGVCTLVICKPAIVARLEIGDCAGTGAKYARLVADGPKNTAAGGSSTP
jgi:hypothetical protein